MSKVTIVSGCDWQGVYIGSKLMSQGHSINPQELFEKMGFDISYITADENWLSIYGHLPDDLEKVKTYDN